MLDGLLVLDLSRLLPGPYCSLVLADLGARVIKIEDPNGGDYLRWMPPQLPDGSGSAGFAALNRNKQSVALDLKRDAAKLVALARHADVLIESFRPGVMARLGLSPEVLHAANPRLVVASISGYGQTGPLALRAGHDLNYMARAGLLANESRPLPVLVADLAAGALFPATAILAALYGRERSGKGTHIDAAMLDGAVALQPFVTSAIAAGATVDHSLDGSVPCYNLYPTKDGRQLAVGALEPKFWERLCALLSLTEHTGAGLTSGAEGRTVWEIFATRFRTRTLAEWVTTLASEDCCVEPVLRPEELPSDPQVQARGLFIAQGAYLRTPIFFAHATTPHPQPAPALGADTESVLREFGVM